MDLLKKYLGKLGVSDFSQLQEEEKETYKEWEEALSGKALTDEDVAKFLINLQEELIENILKTPQKETDKKLFYEMQLDLVRKIIGFLRTPELQRKLMEQNLINLIKN